MGFADTALRSKQNWPWCGPFNGTTWINQGSCCACRTDRRQPTWCPAWCRAGSRWSVLSTAPPMAGYGGIWRDMAIRCLCCRYGERVQLVPTTAWLPAMLLLMQVATSVTKFTATGERNCDATHDQSDTTTGCYLLYTDRSEAEDDHVCLLPKQIDRLCVYSQKRHTLGIKCTSWKMKRCGVDEKKRK